MGRNVSCDAGPSFPCHLSGGGPHPDRKSTVHPAASRRVLCPALGALGACSRGSGACAAAQPSNSRFQPVPRATAVPVYMQCTHHIRDGEPELGRRAWPAKLASWRNNVQPQAVWLKATTLSCYEIQTPYLGFQSLIYHKPNWDFTSFLDAKVSSCVVCGSHVEKSSACNKFAHVVAWKLKMRALTQRQTSEYLGHFTAEL